MQEKGNCNTDFKNNLYLRKVEKEGNRGTHGGGGGELIAKFCQEKRNFKECESRTEGGKAGKKERISRLTGREGGRKA